MTTTLMTDPQAPYGPPPADDLAARVADLVALLRDAEARARARQAEPPSTARQAHSAVLTALDIVLRSTHRWQAAEDDPRLTTSRVDLARQTALEDLGVLIRTLKQWQECETRPRYRQQAQAHLDALREAWEAEYGG